MKKPEKGVIKTGYDYFKCRDYLEEKYGYKERDLYNHRDFWYFVYDCDGGYITNGGFFTMLEEWGEDAEDWQKQILGYYMDEFGEGEPGNREITFWLEW